MAVCELWVKGFGASEEPYNTQIVPLDYQVYSTWSDSDGIPPLAEVSTIAFGYPVARWWTIYGVQNGSNMGVRAWAARPTLYLKNCTTGGTGTPPVSSTRYDCLNGTCVDRLTYSTPGQYANLTNCQSACGGTPCSGECIPASEITALNAAVAAVKNRLCEGT